MGEGTSLYHFELLHGVHVSDALGAREKKKYRDIIIMVLVGPQFHLFETKIKTVTAAGALLQCDN